MQTEKAKSSHFDRTRGDKNQIFPTEVSGIQSTPKGAILVSLPTFDLDVILLMLDLQ